MEKELRKKDYFAIILLIIFAVLILWMIKSYLSHNLIYDLFQNDLSEITKFIKEYGGFSYIIFILLIIMECVFAPFPPLILYIAGGTVFGGLAAGILASVGNVFGAAIDFQIAKHYGKEKFSPKISQKSKEKFNRLSKKYGPISIFILRINPLTSSDLFSYLAGFTNMKFSKFLIATILGLIPTIFIQTYFGEMIQQNPLVTKISLIMGVVYLILFFIAYFYLKKKK